MTWPRAALLVVGRDRVLEIEEDDVGAERGAFAIARIVRCGHGEFASVKPVLPVS